MLTVALVVVASITSGGLNDISRPALTDEVKTKGVAALP
jgi:hypothetical protein